MQEIHALILPCPRPFSSAMSGVAFADAKSLHKKPAHRPDVDDELDVFEAASYYSGAADAASFRSGVVSHGAMKEERHGLVAGGGERRSIDLPMRGPLSSQSHKAEKKPKDKKSKQPISPGGKLASFLNSFFHQGSSKKKSKSITTTTSTSTKSSKYEDDQESPNGRRRMRRSSIGHSQSIGSSESSFIYTSSSRFRTPPLSHPLGKVNEDSRACQRNKCNGHAAPAGYSCPSKEAFHEGKSNYVGDLSRERSRRASTNGILEKGGSYYGKSTSTVLEREAAYGSLFAEKKWVLNKDGKGVVCRELLLAEELPPTERNLWRREEVEDGGESDSSSDLFELPNCDFVHDLSRGLPVYKTTSRESMNKRGGSSIASVTL